MQLPFDYLSLEKKSWLTKKETPCKSGILDVEYMQKNLYNDENRMVTPEYLDREDFIVGIS